MMEYEIEDDLEDEFDFYDEEFDYNNCKGSVSRGSIHEL